MASENKDFERNTSNSSYGGSTYRLSYDLEENKKSKKKSLGLKTAIAVIVSILLLIVFAYFALRNYDEAIEKLYASETASSEGRTSADFQSSVKIIKD